MTLRLTLVLLFCAQAAFAAYRDFNNDVAPAAISNDGRFVLARSFASNADRSIQYQGQAYVVYDNVTGLTESISFLPSGDPVRAGSNSGIPAYLSDTASLALFRAEPSSLYTEYPIPPVLIRNRQAKTSHVISLTPTTNIGSNFYSPCGFSSNGSVALMKYTSYTGPAQDNLALAKINPDGSLQSYESNWLFSNSPQVGVAVEATCGSSALSGDGRYIAFGSPLQLVAQDTDSEWDCYLYDRLTNETSLLTTNATRPSVVDCGINTAGTYAYAFYSGSDRRPDIIPTRDPSVGFKFDPDNSRNADISLVVSHISADGAAITFSFMSLGSPDTLDSSLPSTGTVRVYLYNVTTGESRAIGGSSLDTFLVFNVVPASPNGAFVAIPARDTATSEIFTGYIFPTASNLTAGTYQMKRADCVYSESYLCSPDKIEDYMYSAGYIGGKTIALSGSGFIALYASEHAELPTPGFADTQASDCLYVFNRYTSQTDPVRNSNNNARACDARLASLSFDGRYVHYAQSACSFNLFRYDVQTRITNVSNSSLPCSGYSYGITSDGKVLISTRLVLNVNDTDDTDDLYAYDPFTNTSTVVSRYENGTKALGPNSYVYNVWSSPNGRFVVFYGEAGFRMKDLQTGQLFDDIYIDVDGNPGRNPSGDQYVAISDDGYFVGFLSSGLNASDTTGTQAFYLLNRYTRTMKQIDLGLRGQFSRAVPNLLRGSASGRFWVVLTESALGNPQYVSIFDRVTNTTSSFPVIKGENGSPISDVAVNSDASMVSLHGAMSLTFTDRNGVPDQYSCQVSASSGLTGCVMMSVSPMYHTILARGLPPAAPPMLAPVAPPTLAPVAPPTSAAAAPGTPPSSSPVAAAPKAAAKAPTAINTSSSSFQPIIALSFFFAAALSLFL